MSNIPVSQNELFRKAAVIGSGFGGLALAIRLQSAGVQTTILESRDKPGGRALHRADSKRRKPVNARPCFAQPAVAVVAASGPCAEVKVVPGLISGRGEEE